MVTEQQFDHYQTFGSSCCPLPGRAGDRRAGEELDRALRAATASTSTTARTGGALAADDEQPAHPDEPGLVEDDRFLDAARPVGTRVLPTYAEGNLLFGEAGFHTDCGTGTPGVKFVAYLEPLTAASARCG